MDTPDPINEIVGEGPLYEAIRAAAAELIPVFTPWGVENSQSWWGAGPICGVTHEEDGEHVSLDTWGAVQRGLYHTKTMTMRQLRGAAISLLVYCEAHDKKEEEDA